MSPTLARLLLLLCLCSAQWSGLGQASSTNRGAERDAETIEANTVQRAFGKSVRYARHGEVVLLFLSGTNASDAGLKALATLPFVQALDLAPWKAGAITDTGWSSLRTAGNLRMLRLGGCRGELAESVLRGIGGLDSLLALDLTFSSSATDVPSALAHHGLTRLLCLRATDCNHNPTNGLLEALLSFPQLECLQLWGRPIRISDVDAIEARQSLKCLDISGCHVPLPCVTQLLRIGHLDQLVVPPDMRRLVSPTNDPKGKLTKKLRYELLSSWDAWTPAKANQDAKDAERGEDVGGQ